MATNWYHNSLVRINPNNQQSDITGSMEAPDVKLQARRENADKWSQRLRLTYPETEQKYVELK